MAEITQTQIEDWKKKHKDVYLITVEDKKGYFRSPDRNTLSYMISQAQNNPLSAIEILAKNCFLGGDAELLEENRYFFAVAQKLDKLIHIKEAKLKKL